MRQLYSFYKTSPKRQSGLVREATNSRERRRLELEAKRINALQLLEAEMDKDVQEGMISMYIILT